MHSTEKRILYVGPHRKTHSAGEVSRKGAFCPDRLTERRTLRFPDRAECAFPSRCGAREVWGNPPARLRGTMENASTGQTRSSNPPPACGAGCARVRKSRFGVWPHGKAHSVPGGSRKDAFWLLPHGKTHSPSPHHQNPQFHGSEDCRMRFSVTFRNHPDCIALSRHLRNPLTAPSHV